MYVKWTEKTDSRKFLTSYFWWKSYYFVKKNKIGSHSASHHAPRDLMTGIDNIYYVAKRNLKNLEVRLSH